MAYNFNSLKKAEADKLSFEDIFLSPEYLDDLISIAYTAARRVGYSKPINIKIINDTNNEDVAFTDGIWITINFGCKFAERLKKKPVLFHIFVVGLLAHELGHCFWTDFDDGVKYYNSINGGVIYPEKPNHPNADKFETALNDKNNRVIISQLCKCSDNVLEDIFVNNLQKQIIGGLFKEGINLGNHFVAEEMPSIQQQIDDGYKNFNIIINCVLSQLKANVVFYGKYESAYKQVVDDVVKIAMKNIYSPSHVERVKSINFIICELWEYVEQLISDAKKEAQNQQQNSSQSGDGNSQQNGNSQQGDNSQQNGNSQQGGNSQQNGNSLQGSNTQQTGSEEIIDENALNKAISEILKEIAGQTEEAKNRNTSNTAQAQSVADLKKSSDNSGDNSGINALIKGLLNEKESPRPTTVNQAVQTEGTGSVTYDREYISSGVSEAYTTLQEIIDKQATSNALKNNESFVQAELTNNIQDIDFGKIHSNVDKCIHRAKKIPEGYRNIYTKAIKSVSSIIDKLCNVVLRTIKEENLVGERRGRYYGKYLDTSHLFRTDLKVFKDRKQPKKEIDMALSVLVDESGSMSGKRTEYARLTTMMLAEMCEKLNIAYEVFGHSTSGAKVDLYSYKNFDSVDKNDKYRLVDITARGCNRDGAAIIYSAERLKKRPEQKKIFIIISDGTPNHYGYGGDNAKSDLKHIKNTYAKDDINFLAAAIGDDKDVIKEIYGKNFLNISNLMDMPKQMAKFLKDCVLS